MSSKKSARKRVYTRGMVIVSKNLSKNPTKIDWEVVDRFLAKFDRNKPVSKEIVEWLRRHPDYAK